jgi:hypothetical protein
MSKHTKGPWHIGAGNGEGSVFADTGRTRLEQGGTTLYSICSVTLGWNDAEDAANARLIAAAPQMLDALHEVLALLNNPDADGTDANRVEREILAVIAKATGEQP